LSAGEQWVRSFDEFLNGARGTVKRYTIPNYVA